jgi:hypothetical protein
MTPRQQRLWDKAGQMAYKDTAMINEGHFDDLFYRVAIDYYTRLLISDIKQHVHNKPNQNHKTA